MNQTNKNLFNRKDVFSIDKVELINFLYFLWDKIDPAFMSEVNRSISNMIDRIKGVDDYE